MKKNSPPDVLAWKIHRVHGMGFIRHGTPPSDYMEGSVVTPHHLVGAYTQTGHTRLDIVHNGRRYIVTVSREMTKRALVRFAAKWSRELAGAKRKATK